jgi:hypothetical protein
VPGHRRTAGVGVRGNDRGEIHGVFLPQRPT